MRRSWGVLLAAVAVIAVFAGWYVSRAPRPADTKPSPVALQKVTVAQVGEFFIYLPLYYAQERGYFRRNGLDVHLVNSGGDEKSVAAVIAGAADFGVGDPTFAAVAKEQGQDVHVVASVVNGVPFWGVTKRKDLGPIEQPQQLRGLTVATFPKPSTAYALQAAMFREGGLKPSIKEAQFGSLLPLLDTSAVDVVLELEPNVSTATSQGGKVVYSLAAKYPDFAITGVTVLGRTVKARPDVVRRFVTALDQAERAAHANPADVVAFAKARFPNVPPDVAAAAAQRMLDAGVFPQHAAVSEKGWSQAVALRVANGEVKDAAAAQTVLDGSFSH